MIKINNYEVEFDKFPNGETHIKRLPHCSGDAVITFRFEGDEDLIKLMFVKRHIDSQNYVNFTRLIITYLPYSRMDRSENGSVFTLKYITEFINMLNFNEVMVYEPHSDVSMALLNNASAINYSSFMLTETMAKERFNANDIVYFPDATAQKRYEKFLSKGIKTVTGFKKRDFKTGRIESLDVVGEVPSGCRVFMVDDLCSRGGTFVFGANELIKRGAKEFYLIVTHCEDSIYSGDIFKTDAIKKIYTTNSVLTNFSEGKLDIQIIF